MSSKSLGKRFVKSLRASAFALTFLFATGCGILGKKDDLARIVNFKNSSPCLDEFGRKTKLYLVGNIDESDWSGSWSCTTQSLDLFERFVAPSENGGYTRADIKSLISTFLLKEKEVSDSLIEVSFALKASLIGGNDQFITVSELDKIRELIKTTRDESTLLLPLIRDRFNDPSADTIVALSDGIAAFGENIGNKIFDGQKAEFTRDQAMVLITELKRIHDFDIDLSYADLAFAAKELLLGGKIDRLEGRAWSDMIRLGAKVGGLLVGIEAFGVTGGVVNPTTGTPDRFGKSDRFEFRDLIADRVKALLDSSMNTHSGVLPYAGLNRIINAAPDRFLTTKGLDGSERVLNRKVLSDTLVKFSESFLRSKTKLGIPRSAIEMARELFSQWNRGDKALIKSFEMGGIEADRGETRDRIRDLLIQYRRSAPTIELDIIDRLTGFLIDEEDGGYRSQFRGVDQEITFEDNPNFSLGGLQRLLIYNLLVKQALVAYGSVGSGVDRKMVLADIQRLLDHYLDIGNELSFLDKTLSGLAPRRFKEADLFMPSSNGDEMLDEKELTYYLGSLLSSAKLASRMFTTFKNAGCVQQPALSDNLRWPKMDPTCVKNAYFANIDDLWDHFPKMYEYFNRLIKTDPNAAQEIRSGMEQAARLSKMVNGNKVFTNYMASYDIQGYAGVLHYVEGMFIRFDKDDSQTLDTPETLQAYPTFKRVFANAGKISLSKDKQIQAAFAFTVKNGKAPESKFPAVLNFLAFWKIGKLFGWKINAPRLHVYRIIPLVAGSSDDAPVDGFPQPED